jgi:para-aminobenzoate synthetase/4-amino-4-deoxychorismate lyase
MEPRVTEVFALLDDRDATRERPTSRLYTGFVREHRCVDPRTLDEVWHRVDADLRAGRHAVLLADYEWGAKLLKAGHARLAADDRSSLRVLVFDRLERFSREDADRWLAGRDNGADEPSAAGITNLEWGVERDEFSRAIARIHEAIRDGETYQVNYTYRIRADAFGSPAALYRRMRARQPVSFGAFIALPPDDRDPDAVTHVLSCSPELFLRGERGLLTARPMKGTASRFVGPEGDSETARLLSLDVKNRAENLMIVDLLRNDIGRVAQTGSVKVPDLFTIEPYATVYQMTSTVQAQLRPDVDFASLLRAVFPCGSITGAPKHHTMEIIAQLESSPRGLYTGAIGWIEAPASPGDACGDFCLSVAIRTLTMGAQSRGLRPATLGVGAGIVLDSRADDEFEECRLKARFLTGLDPGFDLIETMVATRREGVRHLERHLDRLSNSARVLGFPFERGAAEAAVRTVIETLADDMPSRLRLVLEHDGAIFITTAALPPVPATPVGLLMADARVPDADPLSAHKTTRRAHYDAGVRAAEAAGAFDSLFFTRDGRLVEGGRSNVFVQLDGRWWTPPVADGALPGVMRSVILDDPAWQAGERTLRREDLERASALMVCNALRGAVPARLVTPPKPPA